MLRLIDEHATARQKALESGILTAKASTRTWAIPPGPDAQKPPTISEQSWQRHLKRLSEEAANGPRHRRITRTSLFAPSNLRVDTKSSSWQEKKPTEISRRHSIHVSSPDGFISWTAQGEWIHVYDHDRVEQRGVDARRQNDYALAGLGRVLLPSDVERVRLRKADYQERPCLVLDESKPKASVRIVQTIDPARGYALLKREKYYINEGRRTPMDDSRPYSVERFEWRPFADGAWIPASLEESRFKLSGKDADIPPRRTFHSLTEFMNVEIRPIANSRFRVEGLDVTPVRGNVHTDWCVYDHRIDTARNVFDVLGAEALPLSVSTWVGGETSLKQLKGRTVLLCFFGHWPERGLLTELKVLQREHAREGLAIVGCRAPTDDADAIRKLRANHKLNFPIGIGERFEDSAVGKTELAWGVKAFPLFVLIDRDGTIREVSWHIGYIKQALDRRAKGAFDKSGSARSQ